MALIIPTVHLNGDRKETLLEEHCEAMRALLNAIEKLPQPNGRNFYPQGPDAINAAMEQRRRWAVQIDHIRKDLERIAEAIAG